MAFSIGRYSITAMVGSSAAAGYGPGAIHQASRISRSAFILYSLAGPEASLRKRRAVCSNMRGINRGSRKSMPGHHPDNRASQRILEKLDFEFIGTVLYGPTGLMHPSYVRKRHEPVELHPARR